MIKTENNYFAYDMTGEFINDSEWIHPKRVIDTYELIYVKKGPVYIEEAGIRYELEADSMLILEPAREHRGYLKTKEKVSFYWFHFRTDMEIPFKVLKGGDYYEVKQLLKKLLHLTNTPEYPQYMADATGMLIFGELVKCGMPLKSSNSALAVKISEYVRINAKKRITVSSVAEYFNYNSDYIGKLFYKFFNIKLKEYIASEKIKCARDMLISTGFSIKHIAYELGYENENLFVKFFVYHEGIGPVEFRNKYCGTHINNK